MGEQTHLGELHGPSKQPVNVRLLSEDGIGNHLARTAAH